MANLLGGNVEAEQHLQGLTRERICRVYPRGTRTDSSNLDPLPLWRAGLQHVALNLRAPNLDYLV